LKKSNKRKPIDAREKIKAWFKDQFPGSDIFLVEVQVNIKSKIVLLIDGIEPISVKDCTRISRELSVWLDEQDFISDAYTLEVSSVGADSVLKNPLQFFKHLGREVKLETSQGETLQGLLSKIDSENLILQIPKKEKGKKKEIIETLIPLDKVISITVVISFKENK
jgi:ribosome maturation factor RimP